MIAYSTDLKKLDPVTLIIKCGICANIFAEKM